LHGLLQRTIPKGKTVLAFPNQKFTPPPLLYLSRYSKNTPPLCLRKCDEKGAGELTPWACIIPSRWGKVFFLGNPPFGKKNVFNMSFSSERKSIRFSGGKPGVVYFPTNFFWKKGICTCVTSNVSFCSVAN